MKKLPCKMNGKGKIYTFILTHIICRVACFLWLKSRVKGLENIPTEDQYIVVSNHQSYLDFMFLIFLFRKNFPTFLIHKNQYYSLFHFFLKDLAQIPTTNGSIKKAEAVLKERLPLFIFPEGKVNGGVVGRFRSGVAVLAEKFPFAPVVPIGIKGANKIWLPKTKLPSFFKGRKAEVKIGKTMRFSDFGRKIHFLKSLKREIESLSS